MSDKAAFRQFAQTCSNLPLCFQPWYLDAVVQDGRWDVAIFQENGEVKGLWTWMLKRKFGLPYITMPHLTKWMGPWMPKATRKNLTLSHEVLTSLYQRLPPACKISADWHPDIQNWLPLYWNGFHQTTRYTYTLDLKGEHAPNEGFNRNIRRNIEKAGREIQVSPEGTRSEFIHCHRMSFQRQGLSMPYTEDLLNKHLDALEAHHSVKLLFARHASGKLYSVAALTWDAERAYYHLSGDDPEYRQSGSGHLLVWESIRFAQEELQVPIFDFEGSMIPGVEAVRRQFGALQLPYFRVWKPFRLF